MTASDFTQLKIWQRSMKLTEEIYSVTKTFPKEELYGLTSQIRRSAISIPSNIAEGSQRHSRKDFSHFISIAKGSCAEVETQLILASVFGFIKESTLSILRNELGEISRMLHAFHMQLISETSDLKPHTSHLT